MEFWTLVARRNRELGRQSRDITKQDVLLHDRGVPNPFLIHSLVAGYSNFELVQEHVRMLVMKHGRGDYSIRRAYNGRSRETGSLSGTCELEECKGLGALCPIFGGCYRVGRQGN